MATAVKRRKRTQCNTRTLMRKLVDAVALYSATDSLRNIALIESRGRVGTLSHARMSPKP